MAHFDQRGQRIYGRQYNAESISINAKGQKEKSGKQGAKREVKLLFLAANPKNTERLRLDEEIREIDAALRRSTLQKHFEIQQQWAVRIVDLQDALLRHQPNIVHFSGHGNLSSEISVEDANGMARPISTRALGVLFSLLKDNIRCVILNACYSEQQAQVIAQHVDCVIGMSQAISDSSAIAFASAFYQALGYGRNVEMAFELGCTQIDLENFNQQDIPKLLAVKSNPADIMFVNNTDLEKK